VYAAPSYLQRAGTPLHPAELEDPHHCTVGYLRARSGTVAPMGLQRDGERVQVQGRHAVAVDDGNAYLAAGVAGMGVLWLPQYMARDHAARGELVPLFDGWRVDAMPMYVAFPPNRHVSAKLRAFIDWVVELMAAHAPLASRPGKPTA
jgi:DNA-binding transcriptional LysR family regulator